MAKIISNPKEETKKFKDYTRKSWLPKPDGKSVRIADNALDIVNGKSENFEIKETLYGDPANTWRIIITNDGTIILLKTSRELK